MAGFWSKLFGGGAARQQQPAPDFSVEKETRIPYQVYETIHRPVVRRQQIAIYIGLVLLVVVLAITLTQRVARQHRQAAQPNTHTSTGAQKTPAPQSAQPMTSAPALTPASGSTNDTLVTQPQ